MSDSAAAADLSPSADTTPTAVSTTANQGSRKRSRSSLTPTSLLHRLDRQVLSLVLQLLTWREKLLEVSHLSRLLPLLHSNDFGRFHRVHLNCRWPNVDDEDQAFLPPHLWSSPAVRRCFQRYSTVLRGFLGWEKRSREVSEQMLDTAALLLAAPTAQCAFPRLELLQLVVACDVSTALQRVIRTPDAFPALENVCVTTQWPFAVSREAFSPLALLPRLQSVTVGAVLTADTFMLLCSLPVTRLCLSECQLSYTSTATTTPGPTVCSTWRAVTFPDFPQDTSSYSAPGYRSLSRLCAQALTGYLESCSAAATDTPPALRDLRGGWDVSAEWMRLLTRIPQLSLLSDGGWGVGSRERSTEPLAAHLVRPATSAAQSHALPFPQSRTETPAS